MVDRFKFCGLFRKPELYALQKQTVCMKFEVEIGFSDRSSKCINQIDQNISKSWSFFMVSVSFSFLWIAFFYFEFKQSFVNFPLQTTNNCFLLTVKSLFGLQVFYEHFRISGSTVSKSSNKGGLISESFSFCSNLQKRCQITILSTIHPKRRCPG